MASHYLNIFINTLFMQNMALAFFLGMCSFIACSRKMESALGLGVAVIFVMTLTTSASQVVYVWLLKKGALVWLPVIGPSLKDLDLDFLSFMSFIAIIAAAVQLLEMILDRHFPKLFAALGIFLPLIAVNCIILAGGLYVREREYGFLDSVVFGFGSGVGWALALLLLAACRERLRYSNVPKPLRGLGITYLLVGLMALGFLAFSGITL